MAIKRIILLLTAVFLLYNLEAHLRFEVSFPLPEQSGIEIYNQFLSSLQSGVIQKRSTMLRSKYDLVNTEEENIRFSHEGGRLYLTYQHRYPAVFWSWPTPNYYDSDRYYYQLKGDWFYDRFGYFDDQVRLGYFSIPPEVLDGLSLTKDLVELSGDGYRITLVAEDKSGSVHNEIVMQASADGIIHRIVISQYGDKRDGGQRPLLGRHTIHYSHVNQQVPIKKPKGLSTRI